MREVCQERWEWIRLANAPLTPLVDRRIASVHSRPSPARGECGFLLLNVVLCVRKQLTVRNSISVA
jgi:hypothetical protein